MQPTQLVPALTAAILLSVAAGPIGAHDSVSQGAADQTRRTAPEATPEAAEAGPSERLVIERTLGEGPAETIVVPQGRAIRLVLRVPPGAELHLHGYDLAGTAHGGAPVVMEFRAHHAGRFPVEAHGIGDLLGRADRVLAYVEVRPE